MIRITGLGKMKQLTDDVRRETVERLATVLGEEYVFPAKGESMASAIRGSLSKGRYDDVRSEQELALCLTEEIRAVANDKHLALRTSSAVANAGMAMPMRPINAGFKKVEILNQNVGYIRFDAFIDGENAQRVAAAAMDFVADCEAIIFDLRYNGGGSPSMITFISSYLFEQPTHLNSFYDRDGKRVSEYWTREEVPGKRPNSDVPVYILTSGFTFSGAEEFSYNLKALERATIIGEVTGGGAHPVRRVTLGEQFMLALPYMRAHNPITGENWEGTGVEPHIAVPSADALERAMDEIAGNQTTAMLLD